jgi:hypothetical protein
MEVITMKLKTLDLITTAVKIHEKEISNKFNEYLVDIKSINYYIEKGYSGNYCVNCFSVIRVNGEDIETVTTTLWFDEHGTIIDLI